MTSSKNHIEPETKLVEFEKKLDALKKENENYRTLFDSLLFGVQEIDAQGQIIYANEAHHQIYGYKNGELIGRSALDLALTEAAREELAAYLDYLVREQPSPTPWVGRDQRKDGSLVDVKVDWNYKRDQDGKVVGFISLLTDITEKKKLQKELLENRTKFQSIFEHSPVAIIYTDEKGTITTCNDNAAKLFGTAGRKLLGYSFKSISNEKMRKAITSALAGNKSQFKGEYLTESGNVLTYIKANFNPAFHTDGTLKGVIGIFEDISERRKVQAEIARRKAEFEAMFNSISDAVIFVDKQRHIVMANNGFTKLFGYGREEVIGKSTRFLYSNPEDFQEQGKKRFYVGAQVDSSVFEISYRRKDGTVFPSETLSSEVKDETGSTLGFLGITRDVTARRQAEQELRESEEKYSKLFNNEIDAILIVDTETKTLIDVNDAFLKLYGYSREEAKHLRIQDLSAEPELTLSTIRKTARVGNLRISKRRHRKKDGTEIMVDIAAATFMLQNRKVIFARIQDITEHVASERKLRELEKRFRTAFHTSPDAININKMDGTYVEINEGFTKLTGYTREDVIGRSSLDMNIWENPEDRKTLVQGLLKSRHVENLEADFRMKDGSIKTALMSANIVLLNGEPHILSITRDITARKKAEEEKAKLESQLRQVYKMEAIGTMAGGIAHDFNNILTIILGNADLARYVLQDDAPARQYVNKILEASGRAKEMVRQILAFSRQAKQDLIPVRPHMIFSETLKLLRSTIPSSVDIQQDLNRQCRTIKADPTQLNQVLINLCANAVHAMDDKGTLRVSLQEVKLSSKDVKHKKNIEPGPYALLSVADTGKGISPEEKERIFDPFYTTKKVGEGTGMGLSVVHGIVQNHGGMISVKSSPGKGSTFNVYFPIIAEAAVKIKEVSPPRHMGNERLLFVDDEEKLVELATEMLQLHGYQVTSRTSSTEALETFKAAPDKFDLVITDQTMPDISGSELAVALLKIRPDLPIILCTGYSAKISPETAHELGITDYFLKPFDTEQLLRSVRKVLDSRK
jgi:two-component system cell cycle sensor histidine kinase/response regulator CckA